MSVKVANNRLIVSSLQAAFYQQLFKHVSDFQKLGEKLIQEANRAKAFRHTDRIEELGIVLSNIPIKEYKLIGQYYVGWAAYLRGERSSVAFEKVLEQSHRYKSRAFISLAVLEAHRGDHASELAYYNEALKCADNPSTKIEALRAIATVKAKEGFNKASLRDLEKMWPLVRYGDLRVYHDYLNSLAVELGEAGRIREAQDICKVTLASPYVIAYPEWRETGQEIEQKARRASRSTVAISKKDVQPKAKTAEEASNQQTALTVYEQEIEPDSNLLPFRKRQPIHPQIPLYSHIEATGNQYTESQKRSLIVDITSSLNEVALDRLFALAMELDEPQARRPRQIDLEEKGALEVIMGLWTSGDLDPNDHVAVLSALRDCDNNLRLKNIINEMITYIFRFTQERMQGEAMWRKRVEAQLTPETD